MTFKINISEKSGKTYKIELDSESLVGKTINDIIQGAEISPDLAGYELEITGASDKAGFPVVGNVEGQNLSRLLLRYDKGMNKRPRKEGKKKISNNTPKGLRLRKTVRAKIISQDIVQINMKVLKEGNKKLLEIFPDQCQGKVKENRAFKRKQKKEEPKVEEVKSEETKQETEKSKEETKAEEKPVEEKKEV